MMTSTSAPTQSRAQLTQFVLALILLLSGFCALVYQTVWLREFRLVFGGAAPAAAAVMAVFMGGLGFGGKLFGSWVERVGRPFRFYARLEVGIAIAAVAFARDAGAGSFALFENRRHGGYGTRLGDLSATAHDGAGARAALLF
jgi:hypothetical protein